MSNRAAALEEAAAGEIDEDPGMIEEPYVVSSPEKSTRRYPGAGEHKATRMTLSLFLSFQFWCLCVSLQKIEQGSIPWGWGRCDLF